MNISDIPFDILKNILSYLNIYEAYLNIIFIYHRKFITKKIITTKDLVPIFSSYPELFLKDSNKIWGYNDNYIKRVLNSFTKRCIICSQELGNDNNLRVYLCSCNKINCNKCIKCTGNENYKFYCNNFPKTHLECSTHNYEEMYDLDVYYRYSCPLCNKKVISVKISSI